MNLEVLRKLSERRAGGLKKIALDIGMSEANLHRCINNNKIQASDLEKIALLLSVNVGVFFDEVVSASTHDPDNPEVEILRKEVQRLKGLLDATGKNSTKVVVEIDVDDDEFIKMGLKEKVIRVLNKK